MDDFEDDTHFCLKCHNTIIGLENYVNHRKNNCMKQVVDHQKSPLPSQLLTTDESFNLKADDFFSSLELRSSSKKLIQPSTSGKNPTGILTRSKVPREVPEPSKSGKNAWIGGHQLKELDCDDNQSKLIKAVANLERRKEDIGRQKVITGLQVYDESDEDSDDYVYEDETSDEDAPPRNHTGGKWKPVSPIYWKSSQPERDWRPPPPTFTGGKWKPTLSKRISSPPPTHTKGKWKPDHRAIRENDDIPPPTFTGSKWCQSKKHDYSSPSLDDNKEKWKSKSEISTKWEEKFPPPEHTQGKWKPDVPSDPIPSSYTKGKWKPSSLEEESSGKDISPDFTKSKWLSSTKPTDNEMDQKLSEDSPFRKSGGTVQYWCRPCNRRLASKIVYERHLKSEFHFKRTLRDNELDESLNFIKDGRRMKRKAAESVRIVTKKVMNKKKIRPKTFEVCQVCNSRVNLSLMGKHLISHYHCRRSDLSSETSQNMILDHIESIILQSPYQCKVCKFFFNTHESFLEHWLSESHLRKIEKKLGRFLCFNCKFSCETNDEMYQHLISDGHKEVVSVINRSVPIVIKKVNYKQCGSCDEHFLLNIQLIKHTQKFGHNIPENIDENIHKCFTCERNFNSQISLNRHTRSAHKVKIFMCGSCDLTFSSAEEVKVHRKTAVHYYANLETRNATDKKVLHKKCQYCSRVFKNFLKLKMHIKVKHKEFHSSCPRCGMKFAVPQELTVHLRTKSCKFEKESLKTYTCNTCFFSTDSLAQFLFHESLHADPVLMYPEKSSKTNDKKLIPHYKCPKCTKFFQKQSLECHIRTHTDERPYRCSHCKATFVRKNNWIFHEKKHSSEKTVVKVKKPVEEDTRPFLCSTCGASFKTRFVLQQHMKIHTGKLYKCMEGGCIFAGRSFGELSIHYQTHFDNRNFKCNICDYKGKTKQQLARHMTIHDQVRKFKCPSCQFAARTAHHLKRHTRLHTGSKPYSCPHCTYRCNSLENLRKHILATNKHPGKSIYECKFCTEISFQTNSFKEFRAHLITSHSKEMGNEERVETSTGVYEANKDSFFLNGNTYKIMETSIPSDGEPQEDEKTDELVDDPSEVHSLIPSAKQLHAPEGDDILPLIPLVISKQEDISGESETEDWSLVECYDVEESGALVSFTKDGDEGVLFEEHF